MAPSTPSPSSRPWYARLWYETVRIVLRLLAWPLYRIRISGLENLPRSGGALLLANHQSHLDPPLIGMMIPRPISYVARQTLFRNRAFGGFMRSVGAFPLDREGSGIGGLKETLRRLKRGEVVLLFPEGTRSPDGELQPLKPGFSALAQRADVPIVVLGIDGTHAAFPRGAKLPRPARLALCFAPPIPPAVAKQLDDRALVAEVERQLQACHAEARRARGIVDAAS